MKKNPGPSPPEAAELRRRAEARLQEKLARTGPPTAAEALRLVHELQVHQIELELQNEELLETHAQLERSLENYADLYDFAPVGYFTLAGDGIIREANLAGATLLGVERFHLIDRRFGLFVSAATRPTFNAFLDTALAGTSKESCEVALALEGAPLRCVQLEGVGVESGAGRLCRLAAMDITERKVAEERLRQAEKMEAVGQLTGGVAHDFNNLLAIILGNLELLDEKLSDRPDLQDLVHRSLAAVDRGATCIHRLLAFSRRQPLQPKPIDLNKLVAGMTDLLRRTLGENIQVKTVLTGDLAQTVIDPNQFENALLNLALNARDAMPKGGTLTLETANRWLDQDYTAAHQDVKPGPYIMLAVSDTGTGMAREVLEHAFEPFFTTKEVSKGSGLGLSMVYGLVKQSGGHIHLYSEVGKGTTIRIYLPRVEVEAGSLVEAQAGESPSHHGRAETILVVEDDTHVRQLAVSMLHSLGYQTVEADNAGTALQVLEATPQVALLFTDVVLPGGMSGTDLAWEARRRRPDLKVLFTSGYTEHTLVHHNRLPEGAELLTKPYRRAHLANKIHAVLGKSH